MTPRRPQRIEDLSADNTELDLFSYSVSHDLRAPLSRISGFCQALLESHGDKLDETGTLYLSRIKNSSDRMCRLVEELLNLARFDRAEIRRQQIDLSALAHAVVGEIRLRDPGRRVRVTIQEGVVADGDPLLLRVLLTNLFENAWKFTSHHSSANIEFGAASDSGLPVYHVKDDGAGFDMSRSDRLFRTFQRLHSQTEFEGTGVGLATVERIVKRHGGQVWSEGVVERGAIFYFTLQK